MPLTASAHLARHVADSLVMRNDVTTRFFDREAPRLAEACREMASRFLRGGRLLAFGRGAAATDAQHVSVEFVHPVIVGKRALPALDVSHDFAASVATLVGADDIVMGFAGREGDRDVAAALAVAASRGAMTFALGGNDASYAVGAISDDSFVHQEVTEVLYHVLWETVHVFFEHEPIHQDAGLAGFLYPFLGKDVVDPARLTAEVANSIRSKVADDVALRQRVASESADDIVAACVALHQSLRAGGALLTFGNGGSASDANDLAIDCIAPPSGYRPIPAISLASEPANITAIANDVGTGVIFLRQLIAQARPHDAVIAFSTSGGSENVRLALAEARRRAMPTVAILGYDGGEIRRHQLADHCIVVHSDYIPRIQEIQASIYHVMRDTLEVIGRDDD